MSKYRRESRLAARNPAPTIELVVTRDVALEVDSPCLNGRVRVPKLREWNAHLHCPSETVDRRRAVPDAIPGEIGLGSVVRGDAVSLHTSGVHAEPKRRAMIVIRIDQQHEGVALCVRVTPAKAGRDERRSRVEH